MAHRRGDLAEQAGSLTRAITQQHQLAMGDGAATVDAGVLETAVERAARSSTRASAASGPRRSSRRR